VFSSTREGSRADKQGRRRRRRRRSIVVLHSHGPVGLYSFVLDVTYIICIVHFYGCKLGLYMRIFISNFVLHGCGIFVKLLKSIS